MSQAMKFAKNPFPGMNPWLENYWGDIHTSLTTYARDAIQRQLPDDLQARIEEYLAVDEPDEDPPEARRIRPDVVIVPQPGPVLAPHDSTTAVEEWPADEPLRIRRSVESDTLRYITIVDLRAGRRVITAIEFLSLANKLGEAGRRQYRTKQQDLLAAEVSLVEIDLLREGRWILAVGRSSIPDRYAGPYRICVIRGCAQESAEFYAASFARPLPSIRIPLRPTDNDIRLPLQSLLDMAYENGRYGNEVDYSRPSIPPLEVNEAQWIAQHLSGKK